MTSVTFLSDKNTPTLGAISHTLCVYNGIHISHVFLPHLLYTQLFVYCDMKTNKLKLSWNHTAYTTCIHLTPISLHTSHHMHTSQLISLHTLHHMHTPNPSKTFTPCTPSTHPHTPTSHIIVEDPPGWQGWFWHIEPLCCFFLVRFW